MLIYHIFTKNIKIYLIDNMIVKRTLENLKFKKHDNCRNTYFK